MKIFIAIPVKNGVDVISRTLNSIYRQTMPAKHITTMVVDNCSDDGLESFLKEKFPWVRYYRNAKDLGRIPNWNRCLNIFRTTTKYDLMKFVFAGDSLMPDCLEKQAACITPQVQYITCAHAIGDGKGVVDKEIHPFSEDRRMLLKTDSIMHSLLHGNWFAGCVANPLFSRRALGNHCFPENMQWAGDWMFWANLANKNPITYLNSVLTYFNTDARKHYNLLGSDPKSREEEEEVRETMHKFFPEQ